MPHTKCSAFSRLALATVLATSGLAWGSAIAGESSINRVFHLWDPGTSIGTSQLVRTDSGISATFLAGGLPPGHAVTMWFIVYNNPSACSTDPCSIADVFNPATEGDFLYGAGKIVGASGDAGFGGRLGVGDVSGSGFPEIGLPPETAVGLTDPWSAEVHLALHSHGPARTGQVLKSQLSSFTGGCLVFLGNAFGQAEGPGDIPDDPGECSTFAASVHQ